MKQKNENILAFLARMGLILITAGQRPAVNKRSQLCPKGRTFSAVLSCPQVAAIALPAVMKIKLLRSYGFFFTTGGGYRIHPVTIALPAVMKIWLFKPFIFPKYALFLVIYISTQFSI